MALRNIILLSQIAGYVVAFILSLCIVVPMSFHQDEFSGHCLLFSTGEWQESDGQLKVNWASQGYCNYTIFVGSLLCMVSLIQIYRFSVFLHKGTDSSFLSAFIDVLSGIFLCAMTIIAALMITLGFMTWCQNITQRFSSVTHVVNRFVTISLLYSVVAPSILWRYLLYTQTTWEFGLVFLSGFIQYLSMCELAAGQDIDKKDHINTAHFYIELGTAQFGVWGSFAVWVGLSVFALIKLCRYHQIENIRVSMYRERQKLINENAESPGSSLGRESNVSQSTTAELID